MEEGADDSERLQTRAVDRLRMFYGLKSDTDGTQGVDDLNMDTQHFDAEKYADKLLREKKLPDLMQRSRELESDYNKLDSKLQKLVYDNYTNFIIATKLISGMKASVANMQGEMVKLKENVETIDKLHTKVGESLAPNRKDIERLVGINKTLKKIQFLVQLPDRLRICLQREAYDVAVRYWAAGGDILDRYAHVRSFAHVSEQCLEVVAELIAKLKECVKNTPLDTPANTTSVRTAVKLLRDLHAKKPKAERTSNEEGIKGLLFSNVDVEFERAFKESEAVCRERQQKRCIPAAEGTCPPLEGEPHGVEVHARKIAEAAGWLHRALDILGYPARRAKDMAKEHISERLKAVVSFECNSCNDAILFRLRHRLSPYSRKHGHGLSNAVQSCVAEVVHDVSALCEGLSRLLVQYHTEGSDDTSSMAKRDAGQQIRGMLSAVLNFLQEYAALDTISTLTPREQTAKAYDCLALSAFSFVFASEGVGGIGRASLRYMGVDLERALKEGFLQCATDLANSFIRLEGVSLSTPIRKAFKTTNWRDPGEVTAVSPMVLELGQNLQSIHKSVFQAFPEGTLKSAPTTRFDDVLSRNSHMSRDSHGSGSAAASSVHPRSCPSYLRGDARGVALEMNKVFMRESHFTLRVASVDPSSIVESITSYLLQTYLECTRLLLIGPAGLHQIQVDTYYLRLLCAPLVKRVPTLNECIDELVRSAHDRCTDPSFLPESTVTSVVGHVPPGKE